ncbi:MAG: hypothetical protein WAV73_06270 [Candidatus Moraniibacteriota bacterium]
MADSNTDKKKGSKKRMLIKITFAALAIVFLSKIYMDYQERSKVAAVVSSGFSSKVLGQESASVESATKKEEALASSENFNATQISVNGGVGLSDVLVDFEDGGVLTISNVKSELYTIKDGEKSEVKAIISCQTNKKTTIEIEYFKSGEKVNKTIKDDFFGLNHMVIITGLDADSVYRYSVKAVDPNGNKVSSDQFVFYTGAPNVSLMDVLGNATQKVFGWAMKK